MTFSASRLTCYALISAMESDMRALVESTWPAVRLDSVPEQVVDAAQKRRAKDKLLPAKTISALLPYTDFPDTFALISPRRTDLPEASARSIEILTDAFSRVVAIRNQVAHTRPMKLDDAAFVADESTKVVAAAPQLWSALQETMIRIEENPAYVLGLTPAWRVEEAPGTPFNNLPVPEFDDTGFFGRREELKKLKRLVKGNYPVVSVLGTGGIGKTALVIQAAYDLLEDPDRPFEAIVWVTAKSSVLTATEIVSITDAIKDSLGLFSEAADFLGGARDDPVEDLKSYLESFKVLLILDNLETVLDQTLRDFLADIPVGSRVIITSRISLGMLDNPISLGSLSPDESVNLLYALCRARGVDQLRDLGREKVSKYAAQMSGHPSYIRWFVAGLQTGKRPEDLLGDNELLLEYCMTNVYKYLDERAQGVLEIFQVLPGSRNMAELAYLSEMTGAQTEQILLQLLTTNFVSMSSRSAAGSLDSTYFLSDFAKDYLDRKHPVPRPRRILLLGRSQDLREQGAVLSGEMVATPYARQTVTIRGVEDAHVARLLKSALSAMSYEEALSSCKEAQKLAPHYSECYRVEAAVRASMLDDAGALTAFERALALSDSAATRYHFAEFLLEEGVDVRRATTLLQQAAKLDPESPEIAFQTAWSLYLQRDWSLCFAAAQRVLNLPRATFDRRYPAVILALRATVQGVQQDLERDRADAALESLEEALELCEGAGHDVLEGESSDLLRLLATQLEGEMPRLKGYFRATGKALQDRLELFISDESLGSGRMISKVVRLVSDKGFGFVAASPSDYFLHVSELLDKDVWETLQVGERCAFEPKFHESGWRAAGVRVLRL